jgi:hypothetical protein
MQLLSDDEAVQWALGTGFPANGAWASASPRMQGISEPHFRILIPDEPTAIVALAYMIASTGVLDHEEMKFSGALLWLRRWEIWSESIDRTGYALLNGIRGLSGHAATIVASPGYGEFFEACALLALPMFFQWDARFFSADAGYHVSVSHEGYVDVIAKNRMKYNELLTRFKSWDPQCR